MHHPNPSTKLQQPEKNRALSFTNTATVVSFILESNCLLHRSFFQIESLAYRDIETKEEEKNSRIIQME